MNWREKLEAEAMTDIDGITTTVDIEVALTILHEARRAAFEEAANVVNDLYDAGKAGDIEFEIRALAAKEGET